MKKELRLGVIGCTSRGTLADNAHKPEDGVRIVAGADIYPDARELFLAASLSPNTRRALAPNCSRSTPSVYNLSASS